MLAEHERRRRPAMQGRLLLHSAAAAAATLGVPRVFAQTWPLGPVRIVVGFPPGGGTDILARTLAAKLQPVWGQQVLVENRAGVAGALAAEYAAQQPSGGSTLLMAHINSHALAPALGLKTRYDVQRDFVPIVLVGVTPNLLIGMLHTALAAHAAHHPHHAHATLGRLRLLGAAGATNHGTGLGRRGRWRGLFGRPCGRLHAGAASHAGPPGGRSGPGLPAGHALRSRPYRPAAARSAATLSVRSQLNSGSSRPKCPYAAVFS
jgi:hypothetical protein